jgi:hypothetical protein
MVSLLIRGDTRAEHAAWKVCMDNILGLEIAESWVAQSPFYLTNCIIFAIEEASEKWIFCRTEWAVIYSRLMIYFGERLTEQAQVQERGLHRKAYTSET